MLTNTMDPKAMVVLGDQQGTPVEAHLWVCSGENIGRRFALDKPEHLIGRTANIDIPVIDERVSQMHAKVVLQDDRHFIHDLGSTNGTFVNNQPLTGPRKLQDGDLIQVGETVFEYISYEQRNLTITLRGTNKDHDAVPANLRAGAQEALNRARQATPGASSVPQGFQSASGTTVDVASEPVPVSHLHRPAQGFAQPPPPAPPYMGGYGDHRGVYVDSGDDEEEGGIDIQEVIRKVRMVVMFFLPYWKVIALLAILFAVLGGLSVKLTPPTRTAVFEVTLSPGVSQNPLGKYRGNVAFFKSAEQNFRSGQQVTKTLTELGEEDITPGLVASLQGRLAFRSVGPPQPNTYRGTFSDRDGAYAVQFLQTHVKLFLESEIEKTLRVMKGEAEFLAEQLAETENELRRTEAELLEFKKQNIDGLPAQAQANYSLLFNLQQEKSRVELSLIRARSQQKIIQEQMRLESPLIEAQRTTSDPYRDVIAQKNKDLVEARAAGKGPLHPDVQRLQKELTELKALSEKASKEAAKTVTAYNPTYRRLQEQLRQHQLAETVAGRELVKLEARIKDLQRVVKRLPELEARHSALTRSYSAAQEKYKRIYDQLSTAKIQLELERASAAAHYDIISPPNLEFLDTKKKMMKRAMLGFAAGLFLGVLITAYFQLRNHPVVTTALTIREPDAQPPVRLDD